MLESYTSKSEQIDALKKQLKFRKNVLQQEKSIFNFTKRPDTQKTKKNLTVDELKVNFESLIRHAIVKNDNDHQHILVGKRVRHRFTEDGQDRWYTGKVISQVLNKGFVELCNLTVHKNKCMLQFINKII